MRHENQAKVTNQRRTVDFNMIIFMIYDVNLSENVEKDAAENFMVS